MCTEVSIFLHVLINSKNWVLNFWNSRLNKLFFILVDLPTKVLIELLLKLADLEERLAVGTAENIQLSSLVAAFYVARSHINVPSNID